MPIQAEVETRRFRHIPSGMAGSPSLKLEYIGEGVLSLRESQTLENHHLDSTVHLYPVWLVVYKLLSSSVLLI